MGGSRGVSISPFPIAHFTIPDPACILISVPVESTQAPAKITSLKWHALRRGGHVEQPLCVPASILLNGTAHVQRSACTCLVCGHCVHGRRPKERGSHTLAMHMSTHIYLYIDVYDDVFMEGPLHVHVNAHVHTRARVYTSTHIHLYIRIHIRVHVYVLEVRGRRPNEGLASGSLRRMHMQIYTRIWLCILRSVRKYSMHVRMGTCIDRSPFSIATPLSMAGGRK